MFRRTKPLSREVDPPTVSGSTRAPFAPSTRPRRCPGSPSRVPPGRGAASAPRSARAARRTRPRNARGPSASTVEVTYGSSKAVCTAEDSVAGRFRGVGAKTPAVPVNTIHPTFSLRAAAKIIRGPGDVHIVDSARVAKGDLVQAGDMEHDIGAGHRRVERRMRHISRDAARPARLEGLRPGRIPREDRDLPAVRQEEVHERATDESRASGDEGPHPVTLFATRS